MKCSVCNSVVNIRGYKPHVKREFDISRMCSKCQDKCRSPNYCIKCQKTIKWSEDCSDNCLHCGDKVKELRFCVNCNKLVGIDMEIDFDVDPPCVTKDEQFYGPVECSQGEGHLI